MARIRARGRGVDGVFGSVFLRFLGLALDVFSVKKSVYLLKNKEKIVILEDFIADYGIICCRNIYLKQGNEPCFTGIKMPLCRGYFFSERIRLNHMVISDQGWIYGYRFRYRLFLSAIHIL